MKKKVLLSSVLVIAICLCLIAGSTFALFTDIADTSIAITSGNVKLTATVIGQGEKTVITSEVEIEYEGGIPKHIVL